MMFKKKTKVEAVANDPPVGFEVSKAAELTLVDVLTRYDLVDAVPNDGNPFIIVSERNPSVQTQTDISDLASVKGLHSALTYSNAAPGGNAGAIFSEPSAAARASGATVIDVTKHIRKLDETTGGYGAVEVNIRELGSSSPSPWLNFARREYNNDLLGRNGLIMYDKMRRSDGIIRGTLRGVKTPVLSARWFMTPCDKQKVMDVNAAELLWKNLTEYMTIGWMQFLTESLLCCDFGYYMFEIVWDDTIFEGQERIMIKKLAPRHPMDVIEWVYDANGGPNGVWMYDSEGGGYNNRIWIPIDKLLVFTFDREAGNLEGISILRSAYKHWYFKEQLYKIDAIQKERHGIGVPIIKLPQGFNDSDKTLADEIGRNLRTNERAHVTIPPLWEIMFAKLEGQVVNALESVDVHDSAIRENVLMGFNHPKFATSEEDIMLFLKAKRFIADIVCEVINKYLAPRWVDANYQRVGYPVLKARRIGEQADWRTLSFAIRNLIGSGALVPDDKLEEMLRDEMDLPEIDLATRRVVATPTNQNDNKTNPQEGGGNGNPTIPGNKQQGGVAGLPKQKSGPPGPYQQRSNAGTDRSGG